MEDSLYRANDDSYIEVRARRLSNVIEEENIDLKDSINIIRMNVEGSEMDIIEDLIENDLILYFDGFYGMWDDVSKIGCQKDRAFRLLLKKMNIHPFPFNGRDMLYDLRKKLIKQSLENSIFGKRHSKLIH